MGDPGRTQMLWSGRLSQPIELGDRMRAEKRGRDGSVIVVHVTHEAVEQIGGIGTVIAGLVTSEAYQQQVSRTILLGPMFPNDAPANRRIGNGGRVTYSSLDAIVPPAWRRKLRPIEQTHEVNLIYGHRPVTDACTGRTVEAEVLLVDVFRSNANRMNQFKRRLFETFDVPSDRFEDVWDFEQYLRLAEPGFEALQAVGADGLDEDVLILAHEYMGVPTALKAILDGTPRISTVFYAHEVASVRPIVEKASGHDTMFYNVLDRALADGRVMEDVFPEVRDNYKHPLVKAGHFCDEVFAVGEEIRRELEFLDPHYKAMDVDVVFNGIPAEPITLAERQDRRRRMQQYAENLLGYQPTWILTHVARPVLSKGIWRDLRILHEMEAGLAERGQRAVYFLLGTLGGQRRPRVVRQMERQYGWPVTHTVGYPDLTGGEDVLGELVEVFNRDHRASQAVFVNQWDWNREVCGRAMPAEMTFADIRRGTDVELGLSVYEPFGISQLEPLSYGAICVVSDVCGCMGFVRRCGLGFSHNVIEASFVAGPEAGSVEQAQAIDHTQRDQIEGVEARRLAGRLLEELHDAPDALAERLATGRQLAERMSWDTVVTDYFLPSLGRAAGE